MTGTVLARRPLPELSRNRRAWPTWRRRGRIMFISNRGEDPDVFAVWDMADDGSGLRQLTADDTYSDHWVRVNWAGTRMVVARSRASQSNGNGANRTPGGGVQEYLWLADLDGTYQPEPLWAHPDTPEGPINNDAGWTDMGHPSWLRSDDWIYVAAKTEPGVDSRDFGIWRIHVATGEQQAVWTNPDRVIGDPEGSAEGDILCMFQTSDGALLTGKLDIWRCEPDGTARRAVTSETNWETPSPSSDYDPTASPDGRWVAWLRADDPTWFLGLGRWSAAVASADGQTTRRALPYDDPNSISANPHWLDNHTLVAERSTYTGPLQLPVEYRLVRFGRIPLTEPEDITVPDDSRNDRFPHPY